MTNDYTPNYIDVGDGLVVDLGRLSPLLAAVAADWATVNPKAPPLRPDVELVRLSGGVVGIRGTFEDGTPVTLADYDAEILLANKQLTMADIGSVRIYRHEEFAEEEVSTMRRMDTPARAVGYFGATVIDRTCATEGCDAPATCCEPVTQDGKPGARWTCEPHVHGDAARISWTCVSAEGAGDPPCGAMAGYVGMFAIDGGGYGLMSLCDTHLATARKLPPAEFPGD